MIYFLSFISKHFQLIAVHFNWASVCSSFDHSANSKPCLDKSWVCLQLDGLCMWPCHSLVTQDAGSVIRTVQTVSKSQNLTTSRTMLCHTLSMPLKKWGGILTPLPWQHLVVSPLGKTWSWETMLLKLICILRLFHQIIISSSYVF